MSLTLADQKVLTLPNSISKTTEFVFESCCPRKLKLVFQKPSRMSYSTLVMPHSSAEEHDESRHSRDLAPKYQVPAVDLVAVEHPFLVKNLDKAILTLGGNASVARLVDSRDQDEPARLSLRPADRMARTIGAGVVPGNNLLLKIDVPKRTGRKRKRGSRDPFRTDQELAELDQSHKPSQTDRLVGAIQDNPDKLEFRVVGPIVRTHRFRDPPDFVWSKKPQGFAAKFKNELLEGTLDQIRNFRLDPDVQEAEFLPPPTITPSIIPWNYSYRQNVAVKSIEVDGRTVVFNSSVQHNLKIISVRANAATEAPNPSQSFLRESWNKLSSHDKRLVNMVKELFAQRPCWTRRTVRSMLKLKGVHLVQIDHHIFAHVAYSFISGPWRDTLVRYGIDPRKDRAMRIYQTIAFRTDDLGKMGKKTRTGPREYGGVRGDRLETFLESIRPPHERSHIFDGKQIDTRGKLWQLCDITDALIQEVLTTEDLRSTCSVDEGGWYHNGTWGKVRAITKAKIRHLVETGEPMGDDRPNVQLLLRVPDHITQSSYKKLTASRAGITLVEKRNLDTLKAAMKVMIKDRKIVELSPGPVDPEDTQSEPQNNEKEAEADLIGLDDHDEDARELIDDLEDDEEGGGDDDEDDNEDNEDDEDDENGNGENEDEQPLNSGARR